MVRKKAIEQTRAWPQASFVLLCPTWTQPGSELPSLDSRSNVTIHSSHPHVEEYKGSVQSGARVGSFKAQSSRRGPCSCSRDAVLPSPPRLALPPLSAPSWADRHPAARWPPAALTHSSLSGSPRLGSHRTCHCGQRTPCPDCPGWGRVPTLRHGSNCSWESMVLEPEARAMALGSEDPSGIAPWSQCQC